MASPTLAARTPTSTTSQTMSSLSCARCWTSRSVARTSSRTWSASPPRTPTSYASGCSCTSITTWTRAPRNATSAARASTSTTFRSPRIPRPRQRPTVSACSRPNARSTALRTPVIRTCTRCPTPRSSYPASTARPAYPRPPAMPSWTLAARPGPLKAALTTTWSSAPRSASPPRRPQRCRDSTATIRCSCRPFVGPFLSA
mmetsp:Transcript_17631/g.56269  ORF Transcript_17631/g.56269 Transcript_17631/m.56269 type:complete len:201 (+) Transcript_17631:80-682(+)